MTEAQDEQPKRRVQFIDPIKEEELPSDSRRNNVPQHPRTPAPKPAPKEYSADEVIELIEKTPLFMTRMDPADAEENEGLQALKALAYEGTRAEIATNFKDQGNEAAKAKLWTDAREYYNKAVAALTMSEADLRKAQNGGVEPAQEEGLSGKTAEMDLKDGERILDLDAETKKEMKLLEDSYVNRALCNLEMKNYRSCLNDCARGITINPRNIKAWYRSATACLFLDKIPEAQDALSRGLRLDPNNVSLSVLEARITSRYELLTKQAHERHERDVEALRREETLKQALHERGFQFPGDMLKRRKDDSAPDLEDAEIKLIPRGGNPSPSSFMSNLKPTKNGTSGSSSNREESLASARDAATQSSPQDQDGVETPASDKAHTPATMPSTPISPFGGSNDLLAFPVLILYPLAEQTDFIKQVLETDTIGDHLEYIFPLPWDEVESTEKQKGIYTLPNVEIYIQSNQGAGKLLKIGKNVPFHKVFATKRAMFSDGLLRVYVVPKDGAEDWIMRFKARLGR